MPISLTCPGCGKRLKVPDRLAGKKARCPECQDVIYVPSLAEAFDSEWTEPSEPPPPPRPPQRISEPPVPLPSKPKKPRAAQPAPPPPPQDDEFAFHGDSALDGGATYSTDDKGSDEFADAAGLPPRIAGSKKRRKTFKTSVEEPKPKRSQYSKFKPIEAEPASGRDHLFFIFALALIPLAISVFFPQPSVAERVIQRMEEQAEDPDAEAFDVENFEELMQQEIAASGFEPHLAQDSWMHWAYAGAATVVFLGLLAAICGRSTPPGKLLTTGLITGTIGILMLLAFQWMALGTRMVWLRGGIGFLIFVVLKFIAFSYYCALNPESGFLVSFFGFTFGVGLCEELCKAIPVLWYVNSPQANWKGAMLVGMASGIGFGISEGITYSADFYNGNAGWLIYLVRFTSCVTLHAVWAGAVGLIMFSDQTYCTDIDWEAALMFVVKYLSIAMVLHGLYDVLLKKELEVWALAVALASWMWLAMLFYKRRDLERQGG